MNLAPRLRRILTQAGLPASRAERSSIKGAPLRTRGWQVRKTGEDVIVEWHLGYLRRIPHPEHEEMMDRITQLLDQQDDLQVTRGTYSLTVSARQS